MCIAIYKPAGAWASKEALRNSFEANPHGAGYAVHDGTQVIIHKGFFNWRAFWKHYKRHVTAENQALIHFRIATKGEKTRDNCHPFNLGNGALMHNGPCINYRYCGGDKENDRSDSRQFAEDFIYGMESWQVQRIAPMIEHFAGTEKVVMLFDDGEVVIVNEKVGHWADGCWWSNSSYKGWGRTVSTFSSSKQLALVNDDYDDKDDWRYWMWQDRNKPASTPAAAPTELKPTTKKTRTVFSTTFNTWVPKYMRDPVDGLEMAWCEEFHAYVPFGLSDEAMADDLYVYEVLPGGELEIAAEVINTRDHLELMLECFEPMNEDELSTSPAAEGVTAEEVLVH